MHKEPVDRGDIEKEPEYIGTGLAIGAGIGLIVGMFLDQLVYGLLIGTAIGLIIGSILDARERLDRE